MVRYEYFVVYNSADNGAMGFGNLFITLDNQIEHGEHIRYIRDKIKEALLEERKASQWVNIVVINYILMRIIPEGEDD